MLNQSSYLISLCVAVKPHLLCLLCVVAVASVPIHGAVRPGCSVRLCWVASVLHVHAHLTRVVGGATVVGRGGRAGLGLYCPLLQTYEWFRVIKANIGKQYQLLRDHLINSTLNRSFI